MREDITLVMTSTFNATWIGGIVFAFPGVLLGLLIGFGEGMGVLAQGGIVGMVLGGVLSAIVAFWNVTRKGMTFYRTALTTLGYAALLVAIGSAIVIGFPLIANFVYISFGDVGEFFIGTTAMVGSFAMIGVPSAVATWLAKSLYPRFATRIENGE